MRHVSRSYATLSPAPSRSARKCRSAHRDRRRSVLLAAAALLFAAGPALAAAPLPVSPGSAEGGLVTDRCPAFSWSAGASDQGYELVVYSLGGEEEPGSTPALTARLPAGAQSWTPSAERCLAAGGRYAWSVRSTAPGGEWSEPAIFEVGRPSREEVTAALETLRSYLDGRDMEPAARAPNKGERHRRATGPPYSEQAAAPGRGEGERRPDGLSAAGAREGRRALPARADEEEPPEEARPVLEAMAAGRAPGAVFGGPTLEPKSHSSGTAALHSVEPSVTGVSFGVLGESRSNTGRGLYGKTSATSGTTYGVYGTGASTQARGVFGGATSTSGTTYGVYGWNASTQGRAVYGLALNPAGTNYGVLGESWSMEGTGVRGVTTATSGSARGVFGETASALGDGVYGLATATTGQAIGVSGKSQSDEGKGVYGESTATSGPAYGVMGEAASREGAGVYGLSTATPVLLDFSHQGYGVLGETTSLRGVGVYGLAPQGAYAGWFEGSVHVTGNLAKGSGSFKIDHPLDPENLYLSHSFVESPDMMNVYNGNAILDQDGAAWVEMPEWFEALNRDFRYQLTALDRPAPSLHVAERIAGNRFRIAGGEAAIEVSWQVTGVRQDAYARAHPIVVEEDKGELRGRYLHPEAHGHPAELAVAPRRPRTDELAEAPELPGPSARR
jgi:hypothetical protein